MRGKVTNIKPSFFVPGITPAYAGKSAWHARSKFPSKDHPRLCGEKFPSPSPPTYAEGSPPPMRGKVSLDLDPDEIAGITPAYAGKSVEFVLEL